MSEMLKSSGALGLATLLSRVLGMVREMVYARFMGDHAVAGAFQLAFTIPNLFRRLLGEGALTAAFIPIFKTKERTEGAVAMWAAANAVLCGLVMAAGVTIVLAMGGITVALWLRPFHEDTELFLRLLRVMFPYMLLVCLAASFMAMLNARGRFFLPALGASMLNVAMIASVLWLAPRLGDRLETQIYGLAYGVLVAGVLQAGFQIPALVREGWRSGWQNPWRDPTVREVVRRMIPGTLGVAAFQLNVVVTQGLAFWADPTILASFNYAVRLMEFPQGVFGISLATYLLPTLSGLAADKKYAEFRTSLTQGLGHLVLVNLLASVLLVVLAGPVVRLLFERGEFGPDATARAALALACLAPGLVLFSGVNILARAFYALGDTQTPMRISSFCLGLNVVFTLWLLPSFRQGGLGVANTMSSAFNLWLLAYALKRKMPQLDFGPILRETRALAGAAVLAAIAAWAVHAGWERGGTPGSLWGRLVAVVLPAVAAGVVYFPLCHRLGNASTREMWALARRRLGV